MISILSAITLLLLAAWLIASVIRRSSAAVRHVVWTCAIGAALCVAPLRWIMPQHPIQQRLPVSLDPIRIAVASNTVSTHASTAPAFGLGQIALLFWLLGSIVFAVRFGTRVFAFRRLLENVKRLDRRFPAPIFLSQRIPGPLVAGIFRPKIVLPADSAQWSSSRLRAVLVHELAHIRRRDPLTLLLAQIAVIIYWFHPLCWLAAAKLRQESEVACDDSALRIGLQPSIYAGELLELARLFNPQPAIPMAATSHLESRVKSILDPLVNRSFAARPAWLAAIFITAGLCAPLTVFSLRAQGPNSASGTIAGTVSDPTGAVVARAQVTATNLAGGNREVGVSDSVGNFSFKNIPAGNYVVEAAAPGFSAPGLDVSLASGATANAAVRLRPTPAVFNVRVVAPGTPAPKQSLAPPNGRPIRVGGNVQMPTVMQKVDPVYPPALQAAGVEGSVLLDAVISKDGVPIDLKAKNASVDPAFIQAAMLAAWQWRFRPALLNGEPIEVLTTFTIDFKLQSN